MMTPQAMLAKDGRKGHAPPLGQDSNSSGQRCGKRAGQAVDDDVVLLEPDDHEAVSAPPANGMMADVSPGAKVAFKAGQQSCLIRATSAQVPTEDTENERLVWSREGVLWLAFATRRL